MIKIHTKDNNVLVKMGEVERDIKKGLRIAFHEIGTENRREIRRLIRTGSRSGRTYNIKGRRHRASAPGEVPKSITGKLAKTAGYRVRNWYQMELGLSADYAKYLEPTRPVLQKVVNEKAKDNEKSILEYTNKELKKT